MEATKLSLLFCLSGFLGHAQTRGVVKDSISGNPVAYASIWVENENIRTTAEENGEFIIGTSDKSKNLVLSALGYQKKTVRASDAAQVFLSPEPFELNEVLVADRKEKIKIEIGKTKNKIAEAFDNGPRIDAKYFPFLPEYKKTPWIKSATIAADSKIEDAIVRMQLYTVDENGFPGHELLDKDYIVTLKKGISKQEADLADFNLEMPKNGVFVVLERLLVEKNKLSATVTDYNSNTTRTKISYCPLVLYNAVEKEFLFSFSGGRWIRQSRAELNLHSASRTIYEPALTLVLTN
ncbi:MAG TPA: carboxypeptidase-like regulatory domain-containing protein [Flavobacterium sp.]|nr:carboxypeptidase-like regulatory domain-containing protein [Flavobacterium sp.]